MKNMIKNDDAVSVVVGAILILAVLVTFMSVVTSSWVPIYEGNAESDHSDDTHKAFMDLHKQIELADEFARSISIDMGTDEMSFIKGSNSVGYLEVNESDGGLFVTGNVTRTDIPATTAVGIGMDVEDLNTSIPNPLDVFKFEFVQLNPPNDKKLDEDYIVQFRTSTLDRWITFYTNDGATGQILGIGVKYDNSNVKWAIYDLNVYTPDNLEIFVDHVGVEDILKINLLSNGTNLTLIKGTNETLYGSTKYNIGDQATLHDVIQYCMGLPGGGSDYYIDYVQYNGVLDSEQSFEINDSSTSSTQTTENDGIVQFNNTKVGGGTLKLQSDYNFMVDQSYVYDSGAVILNQYDGKVFKVNPPIVATNNSDGNLTLTVKSTVLNGDYQASGNDIETLYTALDGEVYEVTGVTDNITIIKNTTSEMHPMWYSYFSDLGDIVNTTSANCSVINNSINQVGINIYNTNPDITLTVQKKVIIIS